MTNLKIIRFFFLVFTLSFCGNTIAQNPYIRHYTTLNGLPTNTIYQIYQDSHNFIWFTSDAGVIKFDGSNYISYRKKDGLNTNDVIRIKEDAKGRIWLFNYNGSVNFIFNNKVYNENNAPFLKSLAGKGFILDFFTDAKQAIHFYNWQGEIFSLDRNNKVKKDTLVNSLANKQIIDGNKFNSIRVSHLSVSPSNEWIIWSNDGIYKQNTLNKSKISIVDSSIKCRAVFLGRNNATYVKTAFGEIIKVNENFEKEKIQFPGEIMRVQTILEDSEGYIWISSYDEGVYCIKNNKVVKRYNFKEALGLLQDHEQNIWVSTQSDGIFVINHDILDQNHFDLTNFDNYGVNRLCNLPGIGILCSNTKAAFLLKSNDFYKLSVPKAVLPINILYLFKNQTLLIGSINNCLSTFENLTLDGASKSIGYKKKVVYHVFTKKIINDLAGNVVTLFDQNTIQNINTFNPLLNLGNNTISERINNAFYNAKNELVINAKNNFFFKNNRLEPYPELSRFDRAIISDHLVLDDSTELFNIDGDSLFILQNHRFYNLTDAFDTPVDKQIKIILYRGSTLYLATLRDIFVCYNPTKVVDGVQVFLEPMNISFNNINDLLFHNDTLYIASDDGLTVIPEASIGKKNPVSPTPYLQSITVNDIIFPLTANELDLTGKNYINLSFGCISYSASPVIYSYKLIGVENKWTIRTGNSINLVYQNLPRGQYVFELRVRKSNSGWSKPLKLSITIKPTLVEYPAFWAIVTAILFGLLFLIVYLIRIQKMKQVEVNHQLVIMEQKALQSMMNPHFIFNSLGSIQNYLLKNKGSEAVVYLSQFAQLIRQTLNAINTPMIALEDEIARLRNYIDLEKRRLDNKFDYTIEIDAQLEEDGIFVPSMIIQPIVENSIWHGLATLEEKGTIKISVRAYSSKSLKVMIEDNGIGLKKALEYSAKSSQHQHLGMQIIKKRLDLLSKKYSTETGIYYSESSPNHTSPGAVVELILPFLYSTEDF